MTVKQLAILLGQSMGARSKSVVRWQEELGIIGKKKKPKDGGYSCIMYTDSQVKKIIAFEEMRRLKPKKRSRRTEKEVSKDRPNQTAKKNTNHAYGYYMTIQDVNKNDLGMLNAFQG